MNGVEHEAYIGGRSLEGALREYEQEARMDHAATGRTLSTFQVNRVEEAVNRSYTCEVEINNGTGRRTIAVSTLFGMSDVSDKVYDEIMIRNASGREQITQFQIKSVIETE